MFKNREDAALQRRRRLFREARPETHVTGRTVIVTDDGIATGSTMLAALRVLKEDDEVVRLLRESLGPRQGSSVRARIISNTIANRS